MIASDNNRCFELAIAHHFVEGQRGLVALAQAQPADPCGQTLEGNALAGLVQPVVKMRVVRKQFFDLGIGLVDVFWIPAQGHPSERAHAAAEQRTDTGGHEAGEGKGVVHALIQRHLADVVAVIDRRHAHGVEIEHRAHMRGTRGRGSLRQLASLTIVTAARLFPL